VIVSNGTAVWDRLAIDRPTHETLEVLAFGEARPGRSRDVESIATGLFVRITSLTESHGLPKDGILILTPH